MEGSVMTNVNQEVVAILDRSGSMNGKEEDTLGGINAAFEQLKTEQEANTTIKVSVKLFDHEEQLLFRSIDLKHVRPIERRQYIPRGSTALLDALGNSINYFMTKKLQDSNAYGSCVIYVVTDGIENSSKIYNVEKIKSLITEAEKEYNIKIIYLAANQDAILEASKYGISIDSALNYSENSQNVESAHRSLASAVKRVRTGEYSGFTNLERSASRAPEPPPVARQRH
tara:strand:- start:1008 stop:1691 length:684 start_codon:yes stop_codon:yes gene_type:complete